MGSQPRMTPKTIISSMAYRKLGTLTPMVAMNMTPFSTQRFLVKAAMMPSVMPSVMAITKATSPSLAVAGRQRAMMVTTGVPLRVIDSPNSPVMALRR